MTAPDTDPRDSEGGPAGFPPGLVGAFCFAACFGLAAYALAWTQFSVNTAVYRATFLGIALALTFLLTPGEAEGERRRGQLLELSGAAAVALGLIAFLLIEGRGVAADPMALATLLATGLAFLIAPVTAAGPRLSALRIPEWIFAALAIAGAIYLSVEIESYKTRPTRPTAEELALGGALILLVLEATRRAVGWILPFIALLFLAYAWFGPQMPEPFDHRGFSLNRIIGQNFLTLEGIFSTPLDVAATFIVLFTIYGAVLERGGAGKFFIDWAFALFGKTPSPSAPGRAVVGSGFLLGTVSGSGVATTVTLASIAWPMLRRSGYPPHIAGGLLSSAGIGATLSPPTLGAAAFIIAEYLKVDYLQVLIYASIPTLLYYLSCWLMTEADARRLKVQAVRTSDASLTQLTLTQGYHFLSLAAIAVCLVWGFTSFMAVFWSIAVAFALSMIRADSRLVTLPAFALGVALALALWLTGLARPSIAVFWGMAAAILISLAQAAVSWLRTRQASEASTRMGAAFGNGARAVLGITATCACAGIIVSIVNLTGLGLTISGLIVTLGGGERLAVILLAAVAMWVLGAAVPVTASYIIAAVMLVPALTSVGVPEPAAHMFMFYYAVLADVSPPTALAPFAAAAIVRADPFKTMLQAWKYTLPAFLVPVIFCLTPGGLQLLGLTPSGADPSSLADWSGLALATLSASLALAGLTIAFTGFAFGAAALPIRIACGLGGLFLLAEGDWRFELAGLVLLAGAFAIQLLRRRSEGGEIAA
ncbi:MAG: TRAP transporter fused permease subunit [Alphaproteobacteria bacterium]|nr:TRAP transporter fused permease subunit [Alphaproteobacteria bacterium]